jgi:hypothetical protein
LGNITTHRLPFTHNDRTYADSQSAATKPQTSNTTATADTSKPPETPGTSWIIGENSIQLSADAQLDIEWAQTGDDFTRNQITARAELRANLDTLTPHALVKLHLTEAEV